MSADARGPRARHRGGARRDPARGRGGDRRRGRAGEGGVARPGGRSRPPTAPRSCTGSPTRSRASTRSSPCSRRATPASRSATRAARWAMVVETFRYYAGAPERLLGDTIPVAGGVGDDVPRAARRRRADHAVELPAHDRLVEARAGARGRQHRRAQAGRADAADRAAIRADRASRPGCRRAWSTSSPARAARAGSGSSSTPTSARSRSPARPRSAARSPRGAAQTIKRVTLELGGKSANVVFADADIEAAAAAAPGAVFGNAGQDCCARSRILVERSALDAFMEALEEAVEAITRRRPARRGDRDGPADLGRPARDGRLVRARRRAGRDPRLGARRARATGSRRPCCARSTPATAPCARRSSARSRWCIPFRDEDEAVALANDTIYGLSGSVWTRDGAKALRVARGLETGVISINSNTLGARVDAVRRLQAVRLRARARARTRSSTTPRSRPSTTRQGRHEPARAARSASSRAPRAASARRRSRRFQDEGATVVGVDLADDAPGDLSLAVRRHRRGAGRRALRARARGLRARSTCCSTTPASPPTTTPRCSTPRSRRGSACRTSTCKSVFLCCKHGIPHLLETRRRLGHQHRLVRRGDGRRDLADLLHGVEGRRAGADRASWASSSPAAACASTRSAPARSTRRCCASCTRTTRSEAARRMVHVPMGRFAEARRDRQRRAVPGVGRVLVHHGVDLPGRRRALWGLRHPPVALPAPRARQPAPLLGR